MAEVKTITVTVNVEGILQRELMKVVQDIEIEHGLMIEDISFQWVKTIDGKARVVRCETRNAYDA